MSDLQVQLLGELEPEQEKDGFWFQVVSGSFSHPRYALAILTGTHVAQNELQDLPMNVELYILQKMTPKLRKTERKKMLVIDLTSFPYITAYVDQRNQHDVHRGDSSKFAQDVRSAWDAHDPQKMIPTILVNMDCHFTGLKILPYI